VSAIVAGSALAYGTILAFVLYISARAAGPVTIRRFLLWLTDNLLRPPRVIYDKVVGLPYLSRWYLLGGARMEDGTSPWDGWGDPKREAKWSRWPFMIALHRFHQSDEERDPHNHPFKWSLALILSGGYIEERWDPETGYTLSRKLKPWSLNWIRHDTYHRVDLIGDDCWTLFIMGPKVHGWGFLDMSTGRTIPWRDYFAKRKSV
jgi:hypothetical protein